MSAADKYRQCADAGMSQAEAARHLGVSREAVRLMANSYNISFRVASRIGLKPLRAEMVKIAARQGLTSDEVSDVTGLCRQTIGRHCKSAGITLRSKVRPKPTIDKIVALAATGMTITEVARHLNIAQPNVSKAKKKYGIQFLRDGRSS